MISAGQAHVHERVDRTGLLPVPPSWPCGPGSAAPIENYSDELAKSMSWPSSLPQYESPYLAFTPPQINTNVGAVCTTAHNHLQYSNYVSSQSHFQQSFGDHKTTPASTAILIPETRPSYMEPDHDEFVSKGFW
ncbi:hypothetical protein QJS10_CPA06g00358 [Acorus calamus]|uniref:Uncharacterized protein n=1 Tax=Acorus calamus TaxID=4465 RepID=A0AAV9EQN4_ACOCL|nr:hypothetical protein QJS10_CPA06g00358 [Acorus calamus]